MDQDRPAPSAALAALGITVDELAQLANLYSPGQTLWRVRIDHFSTYDTNWCFNPPPDNCAFGDQNCPAPGPAPGPTPDPKPDDPCRNGDPFECEGQVFLQSVPIVGTPYTLNYNS